WASMFLPEVIVQSTHHAVYASTKTTAYGGKDEIRNGLLQRAGTLTYKDVKPPGFRLLWSNQCRGTISGVMAQVGEVSHKLELTISPAMKVWVTGGTRCPDCGEV